MRHYYVEVDCGWQTGQFGVRETVINERIWLLTTDDCCQKQRFDHRELWKDAPLPKISPPLFRGGSFWGGEDMG